MDNPRLLKSLSEKMSLLSAVQTADVWTFSVRAQSNSVYTQQLTGKSYSCTCEDHKSKQTFCKHLLFLVARVAKQFELAADMAQRPKTTWKPKTFNACVASWMQRLCHLVAPATATYDAEGTCCICYEDIGMNAVQCKTTCKQWFHKECMTQWLGHASTCPLCRAEWNTEPSVDDEKIQGVVLENLVIDVKDTKTDIVISFDTTGSMYPCLAEVRRHISAMTDRLFREIPALRIAVIAHGDYCDKDKVITTLDFTEEQSQIKTFVETAPSTSGGDYPECYELVLQTTKSLSWRHDATMKSLILIGDAPPHEKNENPGKIDWRVEAEALNNRNIQVFSVQCLNNGNHEAFTFYSDVAHITNGYHVFLDQFSYIKDMIQAICFKQYNQDHLEQFEQEIQLGAGGMSNAMRLMFDTMLGKKTRDEVRAEMHPDRFRERYHHSAPRATRAATSATSAAAPSLERESELRPCAPTKFQIFTVDEDCGIKEFCNKMGITFLKGRGFYEFTKNEIIQPQKEIVLMNKETGELYEGDVARTIAGITAVGRAKIKPGNLEKYRVYIQSTSPNRKLLRNQGFLYEVV